MPDEPMAEEGPFGLGNPSDQILFDLFRRVILRKTQEIRYALHMRVDDDTMVFVEGIAQHNVRCFTANTGQFRELLDRSRHLTSMCLH